MSHILLESLVRVLVDHNADAVVIDAGQRPYTLSSAGNQAEFMTQPATDDQVEAVLAETLAAGPRAVLDRLGAVEQALPPLKHFPGENLTLIAVHLHGISWLEIRRERAPKVVRASASPVVVKQPPAAALRKAPAPTDLDDDFAFEVPAQLAQSLPGPAAVGHVDEPEWATERTAQRDARPRKRRRSRKPRTTSAEYRERPMFVAAAPRGSLIGRFVQFVFSPILRRRYIAEERADSARDDWTPAPAASSDVSAFALSFRAEPDDDLTLPDANELWPAAPPRSSLVAKRSANPDDWDLDHLFSDDGDLLPVHRMERAETRPEAPAVAPAPAQAVTVAAPPVVATPVAAPRVVATPVAPPPMVAAPAASLLPVEVAAAGEEAAAWAEPTVAAAPAPVLARLLQTAATKGATTLHVASGSKPAIRLDAEIIFLEESPLSAADMDYLIAQSMPAPALKELRHEGRAEWIAEVPRMGRAVGSAFYDHRGLSAIFRVSVGPSLSADDLGLPPEVQALALEPEGLILISGPRLSGRGDVLTAFIDLVNRLRHQFVIVLENEFHEVHASHGCVISQRRVGSSPGEVLTAARAALHDDPDILIIEELQSDSMIRLAVKAAAGGHLVIAGLPARTATAAVETILDAYTREGRAAAQLSLSENLCGVIAQVMVRKFGGGSTVAREVLLNTPRMAGLIASGDTAELPEAIAEGDADGMTSMAETIVDLVSDRVVGVHEASRRIGNRSAFADLLKRRGIDTSVLGPL